MDESDEPEANPDTLRDLLADLNLSPASSASHARLSAVHAPSWSFSPPPRSSPSHHRHGARQPTLLPRRASSRENAHSAPELEITNRSPSQTPPLFSTPGRSIFSSGPPTSSISINTAQASMSSPPPSNSTRPLSALTTPGINQIRRPSQQQPETPLPSRKARFSSVEKDVDDPSASAEDPLVRMGESSTPAALTSLFTATDSNRPDASRNGSYIQATASTHYTRATGTETAPLPHHLYSKGLLSGRHSDIAVHVFGTKYALHRLLLDRAPFFCSALSEPWSESSAKEITLHPEDIDSNITQAAFELALKRIYGCHRAEEEDQEAIGLFATGCWLDMADLIEASISSLLRQMCPANLANYIRLVTSNYYGKYGDRVLAAAKAMLCREGYEMLSRYFDGISGDIIREIIGSDGFYVPGEWERWALAKKILNRRLKYRAIEAGLMTSDGKLRQNRPQSMNFMAIRFDTVYRSTSGIVSTDGSHGLDQWLGLYTNPDISPILVLLDEGIHYVHLSFEQLQVIRGQHDILGVPLLPEKVISNALWMSMELRQRILNAKDADEELGFSFEVEPQGGEEPPTPVEHEADRSASSSNETSDKATGKRPALEQADSEDSNEMESGSWDGNGKPRKFWIPVTDGSHILGCSLEPTVTASNSRPNSRGCQTSRISASLDPHDLQWATDFASAVQEHPDSPSTPANTPSPQVRYTHLPPFRFAAEFPPARSLKENKRIYSNTVWYAGSLWNVYVQRKETAKHTQLGIWLHRAPHVEGAENIIANIMHNSVDERIGHLEREMLIRRHGTRRNHIDPRAYASDDTSSGNDSTLVGTGSQDLDTLSGLFHTQTPKNLAKASSEGSPALAGSSKRHAGSDDTDDSESRLKRYNVPTLLPYVDRRPKIKTYFKIYTPSKGGRVISVNESAPDLFDLSRSFGWKSSLDEWISAGGGEDGGRAKDQRLRLMVVIGNV